MWSQSRKAVFSRCRSQLGEDLFLFYAEELTSCAINYSSLTHAHHLFCGVYSGFCTTTGCCTSDLNPPHFICLCTVFFCATSDLRSCPFGRYWGSVDNEGQVQYLNISIRIKFKCQTPPTMVPHNGVNPQAT